MRHSELQAHQTTVTTWNHAFQVVTALFALVLVHWGFVLGDENQGGFVILRSALLTLFGLVLASQFRPLVREAWRAGGEVRLGVLLHAALVAGVIVGMVFGGFRWGASDELLGTWHFGWGLLPFASVSLVAVTLMVGGLQGAVRTLTLRLLVALGVVQAIVGVAQHVLQRDPFRFLHGGSTATFVHGSLGRDDFLALAVAPMLAFSLGKIAGGRWQRAGWWVMLVLAAGVNVTDNRAALVGLVVAGGMLIVTLGRVALLPVAMAAIVSLVPLPSVAGVAPSSAATNWTTFSTRWEIWKAVSVTIPSLPAWGLLGLGPNGYRTTEAMFIPHEAMLPVYLLENNLNLTEPTVVDVTKAEDSALYIWRIRDGVSGEVVEFESAFLYAHSTILDVFLQGGLLSLLGWLGLCFGGAWVAWRRGEYAVAAAVLTSSVAYLVWFPNILTDLFHHAWIALAWGVSGRKMGESESNGVQ